jgi:hypothetical protein
MFVFALLVPALMPAIQRVVNTRPMVRGGHLVGLQKPQIEFDPEELVRRVENFADHVRGRKKLTLRETRVSLPPKLKPLRPTEIAALRSQLGVSQAVFAALLNVPRGTAIA